jgi:hypothetical protein
MISNLGPAVASDPLTVTDTLPASLTVIDANGPGWTCVVAGFPQVVTCTNPGPLASGASTTITIQVAVAPTASGLLVNNAQVASGEEITLVNNHDQDRVDVTSRNPAPLLSASMMGWLIVSLALVGYFELMWRRSKHPS